MNTFYTKAIMHCSGAEVLIRKRKRSIGREFVRECTKYKFLLNPVLLVVAKISVSRKTFSIKVLIKSFQRILKSLLKEDFTGKFWNNVFWIFSKWNWRECFFCKTDEMIYKNLRKLKHNFWRNLSRFNTIFKKFNKIYKKILTKY